MYKLSKNMLGEINSVVITENGITTCIPFDKGNRDYQQYLLWLEQGNQPLPADEPATGA